MKKILAILLAFATIISFNASAQTAKEVIKEKKVEAKYSAKVLNKKASKAARKEAKKLKKEGWLTAPGALPIDKQLDKSYMMQYEYDEEGYPKYLMGEAMSVGGNYDGAKTQALELAKQNLAGQIQTEITALIENTVANEQLSAEEAATITRTVVASKNLINQSIGRTMPVVELYRNTKTKNKEVLVRLAYNSKAAIEGAKRVVKQELEKQGDKLHKQLDEKLGW